MTTRLPADSSSSQARTIRSYLDEHAVTRVQLLAVALGLMVLLIDGLDLQLLAYVAPVILDEWPVDHAEFGIALSGALIGMTVGAAGGGWLGDRWGRRRTVMTSTVLFGLATTVASLTTDVTTLTVARVIAGIGFGAATPNVYALVTEALPYRARARATGMLSVGTSIGGVLGGALTLALLPLLGWRGMFVICGLLALGIAIALAATVPESPSHRLAKGDQEGAASSLSRLLRAHVSAGNLRRDDDAPPSRGSARAVLARANLRTNAGSWLGFFSVQFVAYAMIAWLPAVLTGSGLPLNTAIQAGVVCNGCGVAGSLLMSPIVARLGTRGAIAGAAGVVGAAVLAVPVAVPHSVPVLLSVGFAGFALGVAIAALYLVTSQAFAAPSRATGLGFAVTWGRIAGITTTLVGGTVLGITPNAAAGFFAVLALACVFLVASAFLMDRHVRPTRRAA